MKPGAEGALRQALVAAKSGRSSFALERLSAARALLVAALYVNGRPADVRKSVQAFEAEWRRLGTSLGSALTPPATTAFAGMSSSASRALAEVAALQEFVTFAKALPEPSSASATLRAPRQETDALERKLLSLYEPPASIDRHAEFISASAALKESRELLAAGLQHGAWFKFLQATQRTALLQAPAVPTVDVLRASLAAVDAELRARGGDHTIARVFLDRAAIELEKPAPDTTSLLIGTTVLDAVVPAYRALLDPAPVTAPAPEPKVTVRLVRWPFT